MPLLARCRAGCFLRENVFRQRAGHRPKVGRATPRNVTPGIVQGCLTYGCSKRRKAGPPGGWPPLPFDGRWRAQQVLDHALNVVAEL